MSDPVRAWAVIRSRGESGGSAMCYCSSEERAHEIASTYHYEGSSWVVRVVELVDPAPLRREIAALRRAVKRGQCRWARELWHNALELRNTALTARSLVHYQAESERLAALGERLRKELDNG